MEVGKEIRKKIHVEINKPSIQEILYKHPPVSRTCKGCQALRKGFVLFFKSLCVWVSEVEVSGFCEDSVLSCDVLLEAGL